jgi:hypothetical protein
VSDWTKPVYKLYKATECCLMRIYQHKYTCHCSSHTKIHACISLDVSMLYTCMELLKLYYNNCLVQAVVISMFLVLILVFHNRCSSIELNSGIRPHREWRFSAVMAIMTVVSNRLIPWVTWGPLHNLAVTEMLEFMAWLARQNCSDNT